MKGVRVAVHQSRSLRERRKLVARTTSASVAVVSETAPRWMTASSLRRSSQPISSPGGTTSASWRLPRLRHFPASPSASLTTMSVRPASLTPATRRPPTAGPALAAIAPFSGVPERVIDHDVGSPGLVGAGDQIGPDEAGSAGDQQHPYPPRLVCFPFPQCAAPRNI